MQTSTAVSPARRLSPQRALHDHRPPVVGARVAGHRFDSEFCPIYGSGCSSCFGELGPFKWFRAHGQCPYFGGSRWTVVSDACGRMTHFHAVIDCFGNLVAVPR